MKSIVIKLIAILALFLAIFAAKTKIRNLQNENKRLTENQAVLFDSIRTFTVADSLNAAKIGALELKISEYKEYRKADAELIEKLKLDVLNSVTAASTSNETHVKTVVRDSIVYVNRFVPPDTLRTIRFESEWTSVYGQLKGDSLDMIIKNRERLLITSSLTRKKFLFIKLPVKLFGYKKKEVNIVSLNPNTKVTGFDVVEVVH